ncbi:PTS lactose transporter subunit IIC [Paracoccus yeei]|uniref:PTS lactose transporter subunit IIC n=3 Tax=Paracoccus TaxID=265 RepID=A0A386US29_9RHOB|nr:PTS lactose transporter subunit IIC [Paracoccus yeei]
MAGTWIISGDMQISDILSPAAVRTMTQSTSKKRLFQEIAEQARAIYGVDATHTLDALQERESLGPTGVGHGVALPHARLHGLDRVVGLFLRLEKPLDFDAVDRQPVDLIFALLAPKNSGVDHLKALALVSRTLRDSELRSKLRANDDPVALHAMLSAAPGIKAA